MNEKSRDRVRRGRRARKKGRAWSNRSKRRKGRKSQGKAIQLARAVMRQQRERGLRQWER